MLLTLSRHLMVRYLCFFLKIKVIGKENDLCEEKKKEGGGGGGGSPGVCEN